MFKALCILLFFASITGCTKSEQLAEQVYDDNFSSRLPAAESDGDIINIVKFDERAANANCLLKAIDPEKTLQENGVTLSGDLSHRDKKEASVANVIESLNTFKNKKFRIPQNLRIEYGRSSGGSRARPGNVLEINTGHASANAMKEKGLGGVDNTAMLSHMMAYKIANQGTAYEDFRQATAGEDCKLSRYFQKARRGGGLGRADFAEAFAAYLTNPDLFEGKGCEKTVAFMRDFFGVSEAAKKPTCRNRALKFVRLQAAEIGPGIVEGAAPSVLQGSVGAQSPAGVGQPSVLSPAPKESDRSGSVE